ncbi:cellobiohydrolase I [Striga asiatica]|uniref:Cellobiohydrolase I n=1 Tax=Striga asiatica TaxID=4170 RepID=A0A5A7QCH0_STRAF|nr:cellobiohydrolase I [Striga asiatica]
MHLAFMISTFQLCPGDRVEARPSSVLLSRHALVLGVFQWSSSLRIEEVVSATNIRNVLPRLFLFEIWDKLKEKTDLFDLTFFPFWILGPIYQRGEDVFVSVYLISSALTEPTHKKKEEKFCPERGRLLSGQQSYTSSRLLYDGLPCSYGPKSSARFV